MKVESIHCHQRLEENTLIHSLEVKEDWCELKLHFTNKNLSFFFDHEIDHLPGMLEINAMRQGALAVAHLVYKVPQDYEVILNWIHVNLCNYGELNTDTTAKIKLLNSSVEKNKISLTLEGEMFQDKKLIMKMSGELIALNPKLSKRLRKLINV